MGDKQPYFKCSTREPYNHDLHATRRLRFDLFWPCCLVWQFLWWNRKLFPKAAQCSDMAHGQNLEPLRLTFAPLKPTDRLYTLDGVYHQDPRYWLMLIKALCSLQSLLVGHAEHFRTSWCIYVDCICVPPVFKIKIPPLFSHHLRWTQWTISRFHPLYPCFVFNLQKSKLQLEHSTCYINSIVLPRFT